MAPPLSEDEVREEETHFANVVATFKRYGQYTISGNNRRRKDFYRLSKQDQDLLAAVGYKDKIAKVDDAILANAEFLKRIVASPEIFGSDEDNEEEGEGYDPEESSQTHEHAHQAGHSHTHEPSSTARTQGGRHRPTEFDMDKLRSTLKQFVRDWSLEGLEEREASYKPLKDALVNHFSDIPFEDRHNFRVLVPGAGLGRLAYDVAKLGFSCQGNEFSHYMLLSSFFILNRTEDVNQHTIYPYVHSFSNVPNKDALLRAVTIPDVKPSDIPPKAKFSLVAGDFEEVYGSEEEKDPDDPSIGVWDAVLTCFFLDTAKNVVDYLRVIHKILAPGGVWINIGPLLWHFENNTSNDTSIELDLEEVKELARKIGFDIKDERTVDTSYVSNKHGMLNYIYHAAFWTATKRI